MTRGYQWQQVLGHRVELSAPPSGAGIAVWGTSVWDGADWGAGWPPPFTDVTPRVLSCHTSTGADGLALASGAGTCELELLDLEGALAPGGDTDWLLGRHLRVWVTPLDATDHPAWYGVIDKASAGGTFAVPVISITAYDVRSLVAAVETPGPIADQAEQSATRLRAILDAAGFPPPTVLVEDDPSPLLADDTLELGDLLARTVESSGGLAWADGNGAIVTRNRDWVNGTAPGVSLYVYAGQPPQGAVSEVSPDGANSTHAHYPGNGPAQAVDGNLGTVWQPVNGLTLAVLNTYRYPDPTKLVTAVRHRALGATNYARDYTIQASQDGVDWVPVATRVGNSALDVTDPIPEPYQTWAHFGLWVTSWYADGPTYSYLALTEVSYLLVEAIAVPIAQTTDLSASEAISMVRNHVTWKNRAEPPVEVIRIDSDSVNRYGMRRSTTSDLACDELALLELADRDLELHATPVLVCEGATVTVYDQATAQAAGLALGDVIVIGRNNPDGAQWELTGIVAGIDLDITAERCEVALTALETGAALAAASGLWDDGDWDAVRWSTPAPTSSTFRLGPSASDQLDAGYVLG